MVLSALMKQRITFNFSLVDILDGSINVCIEVDEYVGSHVVWILNGLQQVAIVSATYHCSLFVSSAAACLQIQYGIQRDVFLFLQTPNLPWVLELLGFDLPDVNKISNLVSSLDKVHH